MTINSNKVQKIGKRLDKCFYVSKCFLGPHEFGRPPMQGMHGSHPALHMRNEQQGRLFHGEEGQQVRRTIDRDLKPGPVPGMRYSLT